MLETFSLCAFRAVIISLVLDWPDPGVKPASLSYCNANNHGWLAIRDSKRGSWPDKSAVEGCRLTLMMLCYDIP